MVSSLWSSTLDVDPTIAPIGARSDAARDHFDVLVIGGGNAGISLASRLKRYGFHNLAIVEPSNKHLYQPLFSHIGGGTAQSAEAMKPQAEVMPTGVRWIHDAAVTINPDNQTVQLVTGTVVTYRHLVICPGMRLNWDAVPGLKDAMNTPSVSSNYVYKLASKTWELIRELRSGTAVFTMPSGAVKCDGASQKIMYLACDYWREQGVLNDIRVVMVVHSPTVYGVDVVDQELNRKINEYGVQLYCNSEVTSVEGDAQTVTISPVKNPSDPAGAGTTQDQVLHYDLLHAVPPQVAPDWLLSSGLTRLGDPGGFIDVNPETLQHSRYTNIWSLGDVAGTKNYKSGASLRKQCLVLAKNLRAVKKGKEPQQKYDHYSATPFTVSRSTVVFAEFDDQRVPQPTLPWRGSMKEHRATWILERHILPWVYWHLILKGRA